VDAKNEIRRSIKALFPDRDCFTLVSEWVRERARKGEREGGREGGREGESERA
jgi:hypothetical protein